MHRGASARVSLLRRGREARQIVTRRAYDAESGVPATGSDLAPDSDIRHAGSTCYTDIDVMVSETLCRTRPRHVRAIARRRSHSLHASHWAISAHLFHSATMLAPSR